MQKYTIVSVSDEEEIWAAIENYEGLYEVSSFGRVKSLARVVKRGSDMAECTEGSP